jgi:predicted alpha/beta-hydrolase family hydrolase
MAKPTLLLYPGAGSDREHSGLVEIDDRMGTSAHTERIDFKYRRDGRRAPDRAPKLMASIREDLARFSRRRGPIVMGGRSMGGRMTTMVAADVDGGGRVDRLAGLVLVCYPLHPPKKPEKLRVEHLVNIDVPCLFISGTKDPFGTREEMERWTATIPAPVEHVWIEGKRHDLKGADAQIAEATAAFVISLQTRISS